MSRLRPPSGPTISLFPFLAVLLCTMGVLIVLLVLFSRAAVQGESAEMVREREQQEAELALARDTLAWRLEQVRAIRQKTADDLAKARLQLAGIEEHVRSLTDEIDELERQAAALAVADPDRPVDEAEIARLEQRLKSARESLEEKRREMETAPAKYAVVPYEGPHGTHRRPLYIECSIDGVFLQPEGVRLGPSDFEGPSGPGNPLASALRAAREHIAKTTAGGGDTSVQPYPLLLVRPSGVMAYYAAREAIQSWGSEFGYQLIDEDWTLTFPPRDPALAEVEKRAVEESRERLAWLISRRPPRPSRPATQYRASTTRGGVVSNDGPSLLGDQSQFEWSRQQAARGIRGGDGGGGDGGGGGGLGGGQGMTAGEGAGRGFGQSGHGSDGVASGGDEGSGGGRAGGAADVAAARPFGGAGGNSPFGDVSQEGRPAVGPGSSGGLAVETGSAGDASGRAAAGGDRQAGGSNFTRGAADGSPAGAPGQPGGMAGGSSTASGAAAGGGGMGGPQMPGLRQAGSAGAGGGSESSAGVSVGSMASSRGRNWASLATADRPVPLTRPIQIECSADELRVFDDAGRRVVDRIPIGPDTAGAIDPLVKVVHRRVEGWGLAGDRMYWNPELVLSEAADGRSRREDVERLLADSGLETRRKGDRNQIRRLPPVRQVSSRIAPE
jgi:hypothetical protein